MQTIFIPPAAQPEEIQLCVPTLEAKLAVRRPQMGPFCTFWANGGISRVLLTGLDFTGPGHLEPGPGRDTEVPCRVLSLCQALWVPMTLSTSADP